jgi:hypothetical protein
MNFVGRVRATIRPLVRNSLLLLCCACTNTAPGIRTAPGSDRVVVVHSLEEVPGACHSLGPVAASDGQTEGAGHYDGTTERALQRLKNRTAEIGGNLLFSPDNRDKRYADSLTVEVTVDCSKCGSTVTLKGVAYSCERSHGAVIGH